MAEDREEMVAMDKMSTRLILVRTLRDGGNGGMEVVMSLRMGMRDVVSVGMKVEEKATVTATAKDGAKEDITDSLRGIIMNLTTNIVVVTVEGKRGGGDLSKIVTVAVDMVVDDRRIIMALDNLVDMEGNNNLVDTEANNNLADTEVNKKKADVLIAKKETMDTLAEGIHTLAIAMAAVVVEEEAMEALMTITPELMLRHSNMLVLRAMEICSPVF